MRARVGLVTMPPWAIAGMIGVMRGTFGSDHAARDERGRHGRGASGGVVWVATSTAPGGVGSLRLG